MTAFGKYNLTSSDGTTAMFAVGTEINIKGATWVYCKATAAAITLGDALSAVAANPGAAESATTTTVSAADYGTGGGFCAVAQFAVAASEYFWAARGPFYLREDGVTPFYARVANATAGAQLNSTATAGTLDDASTKVLIGLVLVTTVTTLAAVPVRAFKTLSWVA